MASKFAEREVTLKLKYRESKCVVENKHYIGGVEEPGFLDELILDIYEDTQYDVDNDLFIKNGKKVLEISGSNRSLFELGKYLINISMYETADQDFHEHFEGIHNSQNELDVNLIVRKQG